MTESSIFPQRLRKSLDSDNGRWELCCEQAGGGLFVSSQILKRLVSEDGIEVVYKDEKDRLCLRLKNQASFYRESR